MDELVRTFHTQLSRRNYDEMETVWLELVGSALPLERLLELADAARKHGPEGRTPVLLSVLASARAEKGRFDEQLRVLRLQAELMPESAPLAAEIGRCLHRVHASVPDLEQLLHKAGIGYGQSLKTALPRLDQYLSFLPGRPVLDADRGAGRVKKLDLLLDRVTVDFDMGAELTWEIGAAFRRLRVPALDGYYARLAQDRAGLLRLVEERPAEVVALYLRDVGREQGIKELQDGLAAAVPHSSWEGFWTRARRDVGRNRHITIRTTPTRAYQWSENPAERAEEPQERASRVLKLRVAAEDLRGVGPDKLVATYGELRTHPERKHFIATLAATRPDDAHELLAVLFRAGVDGRVRDLIERELSDSRPEFWRALFESSLTSYRQNPDAFIWLAEHEKRRAVATARGVLSRLLDLLETDLHRTHWVRLRNVLVSADYRLLREALGELDEAEAERVAARLRRARTLEGFRADEMIAILAEKFPGLRARDDEDVVYTTATGLDKAKAELRHMTEVEIPKTAEEIARARAHGDLSENYEYKAAKEKQARLMARMKVLRDEIARAQVVGASDVDTSEVSFGCRVLVADSGGQASAYTILGPWDADPDAGVISMQSPLALLLLGRKPGESLDTGGRRLTITGIESAL